MFESYQTQIHVSLHWVCALLRQLPLNLERCFRSFELVLVCHLQSVSDNFLIETDGLLLCSYSVVVLGRWVENAISCVDVSRCYDVGGRPLLQREKVCSKNHLPKVIVVHVLETGALLCWVFIRSNICFVDIFIESFLYVVHREQMLMENLLLCFFH